MKKTLQAFLLLSLSLAAAAQPVGLGQTVQSLKANLDGDKHIDLVCYRNEDDGYLAQMVVKDDKGQEVWHSPQVTTHRGPWIFSPSSGIQFVGDLDQDGRNELLSPAPDSASHSPQLFRMYRWEDQAFAYLRQAALVETDNGIYNWRSDTRDACTWVSRFDGTDLDWIKVSLTRRNGPDDMELNGKGVLVVEGDHFKLLRFIEEFH